MIEKMAQAKTVQSKKIPFSNAMRRHDVLYAKRTHRSKHRAMTSDGYRWILRSKCPARERSLGMHFCAKWRHGLSYLCSIGMRNAITVTRTNDTFSNQRIYPLFVSPSVANLRIYDELLHTSVNSLLKEENIAPRLYEEGFCLLERFSG